MFDLLKTLCELDGVSGNESAVRDFIISQIKDYCEVKVDNIGNIIAFKKGKNVPEKKLMLDAHTDEVGLVITGITEDGFLKFTTVGGIETSAMLSRRVLINGKTEGVIGNKPIHLTHGDEAKALPEKEVLYIDIGAKDKAQAQAAVSLGDTAVIKGGYLECGEMIRSKALDDRVGCAVLIKMIKEYDDFDFYASFSTQEEIGLRGAGVSAYTINPDSAIIVEGTTAGDIADTPEDKSVCNVGKGAVVSFMDKTTLYDRDYFNAAVNSVLPVQVKRAATGGNNAGKVHTSRSGVKTLAISVPCRYIHSATSVASKSDINAVYDLVKYMADKILRESL